MGCVMVLVIKVTSKIAFIGLGDLAEPMAANLVRVVHSEGSQPFRESPRVCSLNPTYSHASAP
jgi:hypothetical protein